MNIPEGYNIDKNKILVLQLDKSIYGLRGSPLRWCETFTEALLESGMEPLKSDPCMFKSKTEELFIGIYVDDGIVIGKRKAINTLMEKLNRYFSLTNGEDNPVVLEIEITNKTT